MQKKAVYSLGSLVLLLVLFVAISMIASNLLRGFRFDLTENQLFTLSDGTVSVLESLEEPVTLYLYFSQEASREIPQVRSYARRVEELLDEFKRKHAWFIAFAPAEAPTIAVAIIVENGGGSSAASPIARKVIDTWLLGEAG